MTKNGKVSQVIGPVVDVSFDSIEALPHILNSLEVTKLDGTKVTGANVSVRIDNEFMDAAINGKPYIQQYPIDSANPTFTQEIDASALWKKIVHNAWSAAEPSVDSRA